MSHVQTVIDHAEQQCKANGARLTSKRKQVLSGLVQSGKALSAYELVDYCKENFDESMPAMSVYRILDFLESEQLVHKLNLANKYVACAHICCDHAHDIPQFLICNNCQSVKEISISREAMNELRKNVDDAGYQLMSPQLEMNCLCNTCHDQKTQ